jgi:hypothetical protein
MTIDDELLVELFKPDRYGKVGKDALIVKVVGRRDIHYNFEELHSFYLDHDAVIKKEKTHICPDILIYADITRIQPQIVIELENDIKWDFQASLRQIKNYKHKFGDVRVIFPEKYKRFAPLYKNEGFRVYLWKAKRKWQCLRCGTVNVNESRIPPKCEGKDSEGNECKNNSRDEFELVGLKNADILEYK